MKEKSFFTLRIVFTVVVSLAIWSLLIWNYVQGGIPSHSIMASALMPSISNAWGAVLLPILTWYLGSRIQKRIFKTDQIPSNTFLFLLLGFIGALAFGILISVFFTLKYEENLDYMMESLLVLAFLFPIYRAEYLLGFVIGMTYTFGAIIPTGFGIIVIGLAAFLYLIIRNPILKILKFFMKKKKEKLLT